jgi:hypothetical protein
MSTNFDKDLLIKHRFWILLGVGILLILVAMIMLPSSVGSTVEAKIKDFDNQVKTLKGISNPKNQSFVDAYQKQDEKVESKKNVVWGEAWKTQADMMTWPGELQEKFAKLYPYFGDRIDPIDRDVFSHQYDTQLYDVVSLVQPLTPLGAGVVQFNGGWDSILKLQHQFQTNPPSDDEIWFVQEDLWVKRELLRIIRSTNDMVARFQEVVPEPPAAKDKKDAKPNPAPAEPAKQEEQKDGQAPPAKPAPAAAEPAKQEGEKDSQAQQPAQPAKPAATIVAETPSDPFHKKFRNPFWELDLTLLRSDKGIYSIKGTIKNIGKRKQPLGVVFKVYLDEVNPDDDRTPVGLLPVDRLPLSVGESAEIKEQNLDSSLSIRGLYGVEQILTWKTGPIKRIDALELGYPSSRTSSRTLKPSRFVADARKKDAEASSQNQEGGGDAPPGPGGMGMGRMGMKEMMMRSGGAAPGASGSGSEGVVLDRYTDVNDQVRHMPIGMAVIMEESLIPDFIGAVNNSKLRIQVLQCHFDHTREHIRPNVEEPEESGDKAKPRQAALPSLYNLPGLEGLGRMARGGGQAGMPGRRYAAKRGGDDMDPAMAQAGMMALSRQSTLGRGQIANQGLKGIAKNFGPVMREGGPGMGGPGMGGPPRGLFGGMPGGFGGMFAPPGADEDEEETNLVEVAVYGLASLYERYPPAPPKPAEGEAQPANK